MYYQLLRIVPDAASFTVQELLFGFSRCRSQRIPKVIMWMLLAIKHQIWVSRCNYRFKDVPPKEEKCLKTAIARIQFLLRVAAKSTSSPQKRELFEQEWLAGGVLGYFSAEKLHFSF